MQVARPPASRRCEEGITLVELMVVLAIAAIVLTVAVPGMRGLIGGESRTAVLNDLTASLRYARAEAARQAQPVTVCASDDGATCNTRRNANFATGWIVFLDFDGDGAKDASDVNGNGEIDPPDEPVRRAVQPDSSDDVSLTLRSVRRAQIGGRRWVVSFGRDGMLRGRNNARRGVAEPHFVYCDEGGVQDARAIYVALSGRTVMAEDDDGDGKFDYDNDRVICP